MSASRHHLIEFHAGSPRGPACRVRRAVAAALAALLAAGCHDAVSPLDRAAPTAATRLLVGATSIDLLADQAADTRADVRGLNDAGQATGSRYISSVNDWRPYRWTPGTGFQALSGICCGTAWGADINAAGVVVGRTQAAINEGNRAFVAVANTMVNLGILPGADPEAGWSDAVAINDPGQIVGWGHTSTGARHAVLWSAAHVIQDLGTLGGTHSEAVDINAAGQVIGLSDVAGGGRRAFIWTAGGGMQDLTAVIGRPLVPVAINEGGQITGSYTAPNGESHAFLYTPGSGLADLGTLGGDSSEATGLNDRGQVVGSSKTAGGSRHAFLWTPEDGMEDVTLVTGFAAVRKLNDELQTLTAGDFQQAGRPHIVALLVQPAWPFTGFANPINGPPAWNTMKAGHTAMLRFGLGGDRGLDIFAAGSPSWVEVSCLTAAPTGTPTPVSSSDFELRYQRGPDRYTLRVATSDDWAGTCRQLNLGLADGSTHPVRFGFR